MELDNESFGIGGNDCDDLLKMFRHSTIKPELCVECGCNTSAVGVKITHEEKTYCVKCGEPYLKENEK